jgi:SAM-dependent methyltransferase
MNVAVTEPCPIADQSAITAPGKGAPGHCPVCGATGAQVWLQAPDRFHGRRDPYTLARCPDCSIVWLVNAPQPREMHTHYTGAYDHLISEAGERSAARWEFRVRLVDQLKGSGALLDLGCSSGAFLNVLSKRRWSLYGIEMSEVSAKAAEAKTGAKVYAGEILDANFPPEFFDVITCFDVLEHLYEPRRVLARVAEWLKPGGIFYILIPNIDSAEARIFKSYWHGLELPRHLFHFSPTSLRFLAESAGLETLSIETRRNPAVGTSLRYVIDDLLRRVGVERTAVAYRSEPGFAWRAARKVLRVTILRFLLALAPLAGGGESIHAIFRKRPVELE